jgi:hypothetical protein
MAQLTVNTHDGRTFTMNVRDDFSLDDESNPSIADVDWATFHGIDGEELTLHTKNVASVWVVRGSAVA